MAAPVVPLARSIILDTEGKDVVAVKRALSRAGYIDWTSFTEVAGSYFIKSVHNFQEDHKIPLAGYGPRTHDALCRTHLKGSRIEWAWDSLSISMESEVYSQIHTSPEVRIRAAIMQAAQNIYAHRYSVAYSQSRPFPRYHLGGTVPSHLDCSGFVTDCHDAGGARSPNVFGGRRVPYNGEGYTGTLMAGGSRTTVDKLKAGDLVFYGFTTNPSDAFPYGSPTHVALYDGHGHVYSNGHYPMGYYPTYYGQHINCYVTYDVVP